MKSAIELVTAELERLKGVQLLPIVLDDGYACCGQEDYEAERLESDIQQTQLELRYLRGEYRPSSNEELRSINDGIQELTNSYIQRMQYNLALDIECTFTSNLERLHNETFNS